MSYKKKENYYAIYKCLTKIYSEYRDFAAALKSIEFEMNEWDEWVGSQVDKLIEAITLCLGVQIETKYYTFEETGEKVEYNDIYKSSDNDQICFSGDIYNTLWFDDDVFKSIDRDVIWNAFAEGDYSAFEKINVILDDHWHR